MRMRNPVHPGRFLRTEIIEAHDLSVTEAAKILRVSRPTLSSLLNAKAGLSGADLQERTGPAEDDHVLVVDDRDVVAGSHRLVSLIRPAAHLPGRPRSAYVCHDHL